MKDNKSTLVAIVATDLLIMLGSFFVIQDRIATHKKILEKRAQAKNTVAEVQQVTPALMTEVTEAPPARQTANAAQPPRTEYFSEQAKPAPPAPATAPAAEAKKTSPAASLKSKFSTEDSKAFIEKLNTDNISASDNTTPRNILFTYRDSRPKVVEIIGDFNEWEPENMAKGANHTWSIMKKLAPGYYTYNYIVDGKVLRDPNNPRTASGDRSLLQIKPRGASGK